MAQLPSSASEINAQQGTSRLSVDSEKIAQDQATKAKPAIDISKKTTGERAYDVFQFLTGKVFIIAITAVLAFAANPKYAKDNYAGVPNVFKKFQQWFEKVLLENPIIPLGGKTEGHARLAAVVASAMTLFHGGNLFAPMLKWLENSRESISNYFNRKIGKPGEEEIAHERLKDIPKQDWSDVIKGRIVAFVTVVTSFITADILLGKDKQTNKYWFDKYEDWFARKFAYFSKEGKAIAATPIAQELTEIQQANKTYRFGKVIALDLYATSAAIIIWNAISRLSAKKRANKSVRQDVAHDVSAAMGMPTSLVDDDDITASRSEPGGNATSISPQRRFEPKGSFTARLDSKPPTESQLSAAL